jgi:hypothetical protein
MEQWTDECSDGMTRLLDGWQGTDFSDLQNLLNSEIPVKQHLYIQVILSKQNKANHKLTCPMPVRTKREQDILYVTIRTKMY